jgi:hypothetical protein
MAATIGFYLSGVIAIAIIFIGCRFLLAASFARSILILWTSMAAINPLVVSRSGDCARAFA